jgi:hypothetical protein
MIRSCPEEGLPRIGTDKTDLRTGKSNDEVQGAFAALRMTAKTATATTTTTTKADP